jgi:hypothetical protein
VKPSFSKMDSYCLLYISCKCTRLEAEFLGALGHKSLEFSSMLFAVTSTNGNLKSENSQDYAQKSQRNSAFMNSASAVSIKVKDLRNVEQKIQQQLEKINVINILQGPSEAAHKCGVKRVRYLCLNPLPDSPRSNLTLGLTAILLFPSHLSALGHI